MLSSDARASLYWPGCSIGRGSVSGSGGGPGCGGGASELLVLVLDEEVDDVEEVVSSWFVTCITVIGVRARHVFGRIGCNGVVVQTDVGALWLAHWWAEVVPPSVCESGGCGCLSISQEMLKQCFLGCCWYIARRVGDHVQSPR